MIVTSVDFVGSVKKRPYIYFLNVTKYKTFGKTLIIGLNQKLDQKSFSITL